LDLDCFERCSAPRGEGEEDDGHKSRDEKHGDTAHGLSPSLLIVMNQKSDRMSPLSAPYRIFDILSITR